MLGWWHKTELMDRMKRRKVDELCPGDQLER